MSQATEGWRRGCRPTSQVSRGIGFLSRMRAKGETQHGPERLSRNSFRSRRRPPPSGCRRKRRPGFVHGRQSIHTDLRSRKSTRGRAWTSDKRWFTVFAVWNVPPTLKTPPSTGISWHRKRLGTFTGLMDFCRMSHETWFRDRGRGPQLTDPVLLIR